MITAPPVPLVPQLARTQIRNQMIAAAVPPGIADEAIDLGCFAAEQAANAFNAVIARASDESVMTAAFSIANGILAPALAERMNSLQAAIQRRGGIVLSVQTGTLFAEGGRTDG